MKRQSPGRNELELVVAISHLPQPVGSREARRALERQGVLVSEATVTRLLRLLDDRGLTRPISSKGRALTEHGQRLALATQMDRRRSEQFALALDVRSLDDLIDLLHARRGVEREAARAAAIRGTDVEFTRLEDLLSRHQGSIDAGEIPRQPALEFHRLIGRASHNKVIRALTETVFDPRLDRVEQVLDVVTTSRRSVGRSPEDHRKILDALRSRNPQRAEAAMAAHLDRLLADVEASADAGSGGLIEGLMQVNQGGADWQQ